MIDGLNLVVVHRFTCLQVNRFASLQVYKLTGLQVFKFASGVSLNTVDRLLSL